MNDIAIILINDIILLQFINYVVSWAVNYRDENGIFEATSDEIAPQKYSQANVIYLYRELALRNSRRAYLV